GNPCRTIRDPHHVTMVRAHGADRVLFGTDSPWADQKGELEHLRSLPFSEKELDNICGENAARLLHHRLPPSRTEG
ncbi:MAG TPA: amidohydrolase family protein, partial [bacterium]|nr:amidohydrolase family protein [bacterium]